MKKITLLVMVFAVLLGTANIGFAQKGNIDIIRQGLLGAGAGAIASSVSGGKSDNLWIGALTGAGVNIIGGSLLDIITEKNDTGTVPAAGYYNSYSPAYRYSGSTRPVYIRRREYVNNTVAASQNTYSDEFMEGFNMGYKEGYMAGYKEAVKNLTENR